MIENAQQKSDKTITENMINKLGNELKEKNNYFETVQLNVPEYTEDSDQHIDSLFGDKNFHEINSIIYEEELISNTKISKISDSLSRVNTKKIKIAAVLTLLISGATFAGTAIFNLEDNNFVADASPLPQIESQNQNVKAIEIKNKVSSGELYNNSYTFKYQVKDGDSLTNIAEKAGISAEAIKSMNGLTSDIDLQNKETLLIPTSKNILHKIANGDTLDSVSRRYNVSIKEITDLNKSNLKNPNYLQIDQVLFIPWSDAVIKAKKDKVSSIENSKKSIVAKPSNSRESNSIHKLNKGETLLSLAMKYKVSVDKIMAANANLKPENLQINQPVIIPTNMIDRNGSRSRTTRVASRSLTSGTNERGLRYSGRFFWPASGEYSSGFGPRGGRFHSGIDIAAAVGTPINSVMNGTVIYTGWESGYGMTVEIRHPNGLVTRYAHCSQIFVSNGQQVDGGQKIAAMGMTGHVTGPHLHFEVLVNGSQVNPRQYF
jgi:murein DD-endopeptidase MepM/ murein hydrolase activator NlpD